jgi:hypothetical protein
MRARLALFAVLTLFPAASSPAQTQPPSTPGSSSAANEVAVIGCLQREADFRALTDAGRGGVLGSGVGVGNEYVLSDAVPADTHRNSRMRPRPAEPNAVGTSGSTRHYSLTGKLEENLLRDVGRMVEIVGTVEEPSESDRLPRLTINVWHPVGDFCPQK